MECAIGDAPSPDGTPGPSESPYLYNYSYSWPQSDIRSMPQSTYNTVATEPRYSHSASGVLAATIPGPYAFHA